METIPTPPNPFVDATGAFVIPTFADWFFLPGDWTVYLLASRAPAIAEILGVGSSAYGGTFASILASAFWLLLAIASIATVSAVRRFDRAVTGGIAYGVAELRRRARMAIVLARYRRSRRAVRKEPIFEGEEITSPATSAPSYDTRARASRSYDAEPPASASTLSRFW
jgi:hypothetical protein